MLVGIVQVGTLDQNKHLLEQHAGMKRGTYPNVFAASFASGLMYSIVTLPFETAKNRMAFQKPDANGVLPYRSTVQTITAVAKESGAMALWNGFTPYYCRCGGHTVAMFVLVEMLRGFYAPGAVS